jgi:hypothetical protein
MEPVTRLLASTGIMDVEPGDRVDVDVVRMNRAR